MRLVEIEVNANKKLIDIIQHNEFAINFYDFYNQHYRETDKFSFDPYRFYSPAEIIDILNYIESVSVIIEQVFNNDSQIRIMLNELINYFET